MCDYSLQHIASRPAKVGDQLVTTRFTRSVTGGFAAVGEPNVAVCLLPGTELAFDNEIEAEAAFRVLPPKRQGASVARFRRINEDQPNMHHDALELPGGKVVLVNHLREGQHASVLQLPASPRSEAEPASEMQEQRTSITA